LLWWNWGLGSATRTLSETLLDTFFLSVWEQTREYILTKNTYSNTCLKHTCFVLSGRKWLGDLTTDSPSRLLGSKSRPGRAKSRKNAKITLFTHVLGLSVLAISALLGLSALAISALLGLSVLVLSVLAISALLGLSTIRDSRFVLVLSREDRRQTSQ